MKNLTVIPRKELVVFPALEGHVYGAGKYLVVTKCKAGFPTTSIVDADSPIAAFRKYKPKAIMNISKMCDRHNSTVFARVGKKVWAAEELLKEMIQNAEEQQQEYKEHYKRRWSDVED